MLVELRVRSIDRQLEPGGYVAISITAKLKKDSFIYNDEPIMLAYLKDGDWYFALTYFDV